MSNHLNQYILVQIMVKQWCVLLDL